MWWDWPTHSLLGSWQLDVVKGSLLSLSFHSILLIFWGNCKFHITKEKEKENIFHFSNLWMSGPACVILVMLYTWTRFISKLPKFIRILRCFNQVPQTKPAINQLLEIIMGGCWLLIHPILPLPTTKTHLIWYATWNSMIDPPSCWWDGYSSNLIELPNFCVCINICVLLGR